MTAPAPGRCRHCGCTEDQACVLGNGDACAWVDGSRTVCSNPSCIRAEKRRTKGEERAANRKHGDRFVGWGYGAVVDELEKDRRRRVRSRKRKVG
jgi:hypothetical protein